MIMAYLDIKRQPTDNHPESSPGAIDARDIPPGAHDDQARISPVPSEEAAARDHEDPGALAINTLGERGA